MEISEVEPGEPAQEGFDPWNSDSILAYCQNVIDRDLRAALLEAAGPSDDNRPWAFSDDFQEEDAENGRAADSNSEAGEAGGWLSEYGTALEAVALAAFNYAEREAKASPNAGVQYSFPAILDTGLNVVRSLRSLRHHEGDDQPEELKLWSYRQHLAAELFSYNFPYKADLSSVVSDYIRLPYRCGHLDRLLTDLLIAQACFSFKDEAFGGIFRRLPMGVISACIVWALAAATGFAVLFFADGERPLTGVIGALAAALIVVGAGALAWAPGDYSLTNRFRRFIEPKVWLIREMIVCYLHLETFAPVSARQLIERFRHASDMGAVWPPELHVLLDDVMARGGLIAA